MAKKKASSSSQAPVPSTSPKSATWGYVVIKEDKGHEPLIHVNRQQKDVKSKLYFWFPGKSLKKQVPDGAAVILRCEASRNGERRFSPIGTGNRSLDPFLPFYLYAFTCGLAILIKSRKMTKRERQSYRAMYFLFQRAQKMRQHIRHLFKSKKDLTVVRSGLRSKEESESHILPWQFSAATKAMGYPQSVDGFLARGQKEAKKSGVSHPSVTQKIHYGLVALARLAPKPLKPDEMVRVLKSVLFDLPAPAKRIDEQTRQLVDTETTAVDPETKDLVTERILVAIWPHLGDTSAVFNDWFWGRHNSFIKQIAQQKKSPGGELDPSVVERVLLERGWEAYEYVGQCVQTWARDMVEAIPEPLTEKERRAFETLYFCRPEFGGIPLILLAEKLQFVDTVLEDIVNNPGKDRPVQVLYQLLQFYAAMVANRREADVRIGEAKTGTEKWLKKESGQKLSADVGPELEDTSTSENRVEDLDHAHAIYRGVAKAKNITCKCPKPDWGVKPEQVEKTHEFRLTFRCQKCGVEKKKVLSIKELQDIESRLR